MKRDFTLFARAPFQLSQRFYLASLPLMALGAVMAGCSTTSAIHTDLDSCMETHYEAYKTLDKKNQIGASSANLGYNEHCSASQRAVRLGMVKDPETGHYSVLALRTLRLYVQDPELDRRTLAQIELRLRLEHGIGVGDLIKLEQAQWRRDRGIGPTIFTCRDVDGVRRCHDAPTTPPAKPEEDLVVPPAQPASSASGPAP